MKTVSWLGLLLIIWYLEYTLRKENRVTIMRLPFGLRGAFIPPFGTFVHPDHQTETVLEHENCHRMQWQELGTTAFLLKYLYQYLRYGYNDMPMETECRSGESEYCRIHYTDCYPKNF